MYRLVRGNVLALPLAGGGKAALHGQARCCWTTPCAATNKGRLQLLTSLQKLVWRCMDALRCCEPLRRQESSEDGHCCGQSYEMAAWHEAPSTSSAQPWAYFSPRFGSFGSPESGHRRSGRFSNQRNPQCSTNLAGCKRMPSMEKWARCFLGLLDYLSARHAVWEH